MSLVSWATSSSAAPSVSNSSRFSRSARPAVGALNKIKVVLLNQQTIVVT